MKWELAVVPKTVLAQYVALVCVVVRQLLDGMMFESRLEWERNLLFMQRTQLYNDHANGAVDEIDADMFEMETVRLAYVHLLQRIEYLHGKYALYSACNATGLLTGAIGRAFNELKRTQEIERGERYGAYALGMSVDDLRQAYNPTYVPEA